MQARGDDNEAGARQAASDDAAVAQRDGGLVAHMVRALSGRP